MWNAVPYLYGKMRITNELPTGFCSGGAQAVGMRFWVFNYAVACVLLLVGTTSVSAYVPEGRWSTTASGSTGVDGDPATVTWSIVADGTNLSGEGASDLVSFLDTNFGAGPGGLDLTQRPWFPYFDSSFDRWGELSGITYLYEPNDDGKRQGTFWAGSLGVRGDVRIGGADIDGASNTIAYNYYPNNGDMVIDTADSLYLSNSYLNYRRIRNTVAHEAGHGFGLDHVESSTSNFLLEPYITTAYDGPQLDDIRGVQALYGDFFEKSNSGQGNDTAGLATSLGSLAAGSSLSIGTDASDTVVSSTDTDFLSIDSNTDTDFFSLSVDGPSLLDVALIPVGPTYNQGAQGEAQTSIDTSSLSDLALSVFDVDGTSLLGQSDGFGLGQAESLVSLDLPAAGEYYIRIIGDDSAALDIVDTAQFYQLDLSVESSVVYFTADFDQDGDVDADDLGDWEASYGVDAGGDTDGDGDTDGLDFLTWQTQFMGNVAPSLPAVGVPEPSALVLASLAGLFFWVRRV